MGRAGRIVGALAFALGMGACVGLNGLTGHEPDPAPSNDDASVTLPTSTLCQQTGAPDCGKHGRCTEAAGTAACICDVGYLGAFCGECGPELQDNDHDGECAPTCASLTCPSHSTCKDDSGKATCVCITAYEKAGNSCVFKSPIQDPTFEQKPTGAWTLGGTASIDAAAAGGLDPGTTDLSVCPASVRQSYLMPAAADAEPLALEVSASIQCVGESCSDGLFEIGFGGRFLAQTGQAAVPPNFNKQRFCVGERGLGAVSLTIGSTCYPAWVDHVSIVPASDCPMPGEIYNGNFEAAGGWTAILGADVAVGVGTGNSRGGRLVSQNGCQSPELQGLISVPSSMPGPALSFTFKGTNAARPMFVSMSSYQKIASVAGSGTFERASICLPQWARGLVVPLRLGIPASCGAPVPATEFVFDDVTVTSDPACAEPGLVIDGGFEGEGTQKAWPYDFQQGATVSFPTSNAHGGTSFVQIAGTSCTYGVPKQLVTIPDTNLALGGPVVKYWYRAFDDPNANYMGPDGASLPAASAWTQKTFCLEPQRAGRFYSVGFYVTSKTCSSPSFKSLAIDDVEVGYDPGCPAQ